MDFLDPRKKRARIIQLYVGYVLMAIVIGIGTLILLFAAFGYGVDTKGNVYQNGLVFVASTPNAAEATLTNTETNKERQVVTDERLILPAGPYKVVFLKQGYRPWQHDVDLRGGGIKRLTYPFLFPEQLNTRDIENYTTQPKMISSTPDRSRMVIQPSGKFKGLQIFDASDPDAEPQTITIPNTVIPSDTTTTLTVVEWASNNRNVIVSFKSGKTTEYALLDIENASRSFNINKQLNVSPKSVALFDKGSTQLYVLLPNNRLVRSNVQNKTSETVAEDVLNFKSHGDDMVLYATTRSRSANNRVSVLLKQGKQTYKIRELPLSPKYLLDLARYNDQWQVAIAASKDEHAYVYRDPIETLTSGNRNRIMAIRTMKLHNPAFLSFSDNAQFVAVQNNGNFAVYDALNNEQFSYTIETPFDKTETKWMDGHRLVNSAAGNIVVFDFDGTNYQTLSNVLPLAPVLFDQSYERMYALAPKQDDPKEFALSLTNLRVE